MSEGQVSAASLSELVRQEEQCTRCPLYREATQVVPGEGHRKATLMFVGEQPGDKEDLAGKPFVGPAGHVFDEVLAEAGIERSSIFITNAVKHFKFAPRGKKRLHKRPNAREIESCKWWLMQERKLVVPAAIIALGATAVRSLLGRPLSIASLRGRIVTLEDGTPLVGTIHPSYLLRIRNATDRANVRQDFIADLVRSRKLVETGPPGADRSE